MHEPFVSSNPGAWMRPYYVQLSRRPGFANLAPALKFRALVDAIAQDQPGRAAEMRDSNVTTQSAILGWLADVTSQKPAVRETELWRVRKGERELRCSAVYLPTGIDLRLMESDEFRRTQLCPDAPSLHAISANWHSRLVEARWADTSAVPAGEASSASRAHPG